MPDIDFAALYRRRRTFWTARHGVSADTIDRVVADWGKRSGYVDPLVLPIERAAELAYEADADGAGNEVRQWAFVRRLGRSPAR